ncbi:MAG: type II toxin-antitoxin system VapC family toxin [Burkholderiaceae bacterium]
MSVVVDSSGWIEHFLDSEQADFFAPALADSADLIVPALSLYEVHKRLSRGLPDDVVQDCLNVMRRGTVIDITDARAVHASQIGQRHKLALADSVMYSIAQEFGAMLWTQDIDYQGLPGVKFKAKY